MAQQSQDPGFDPAALTRLLDGRHGELREWLRELLARDEFAPVHGLSTPEYRQQVMAWARKLASEGLTLPGLPERYGGRDDPGANVAEFETIAFSDLSLLVMFGVQYGLWGGAVHQLGTERHHEAYLRQIVSYELPGCFAMTEGGHGSNVQGVRTTATYDPDADEFVVETPDDDARKEYIGNAACHGRMAAVFAQLIVDGENHGVHTLIVPLRDEQGNLHEGVRIEDSGEKMGLNGVDNGSIWFDRVRVPRDALLDRYAEVDDDGRYSSPIEDKNKRFFTMLSALVQGRVTISAASLSAAKSALTIAVRYGLRRRQSGPADEEDEVLILDYPSHQRRLMPLLAETYALHFAQQELTEWFHAIETAEEGSESERRELESMAAGMKATSSWHATDTIQTCRECCGGAGYMAVNRFAALKGDSDVFTTFEGDNTVLMQLVAKGVLTGYKDQFGDLNPRQMVTFIASQTAETIAERLVARKILQRIEDVVPTPGDDASLPDREDQLELFRWREGHLTKSVAQRYREASGESKDSFEVFREVQTHAVSAARSHMHTLILEAFDRAIEGCEDETLKAPLNLLCDLYAMRNIERDAGFFQEHGRLSSTRCKAIGREVDRLCGAVRDQAAGLVDAFAIPDAVLGAPIGLRASELTGQPAPA